MARSSQAPPQEEDAGAKGEEGAPHDGDNRSAPGRSEFAKTFDKVHEKWQYVRHPFVSLTAWVVVGIRPAVGWVRRRLEPIGRRVEAMSPGLRRKLRVEGILIALCFLSMTCADRVATDLLPFDETFPGGRTVVAPTSMVVDVQRRDKGVAITGAVESRERVCSAHRFVLVRAGSDRRKVDVLLADERGRWSFVWDKPRVPLVFDLLKVNVSPAAGGRLKHCEFARSVVRPDDMEPRRPRASTRKPPSRQLPDPGSSAGPVVAPVETGATPYPAPAPSDDPEPARPDPEPARPDPEPARPDPDKSGGPRLSFDRRQDEEEARDEDL
jgi:hypothetical protein